jgi:hypothetical protein
VFATSHPVRAGAGCEGLLLLLSRAVIKFVAERKNKKIIMALANSRSRIVVTESKVVAESKKKQMKCFFEGECCALSYGDDDDWFDDEDEEFVFDPKGANKWFEEALEAGLKEREEMMRIPKKTDENDENDGKRTIVINIIF